MNIRIEEPKVEPTKTSHPRVEEIYTRVFKEQNDKTVLDLGSGDGRKGCKIYLHKGCDPTKWHAIDGQKQLLDILDKLNVNTYNLNLYETKIEKHLPSDLEADIFLCVEFIEHFATTDEQIDLLSQGIQFVKQGGDMCVSYPEVAVLDGKKFGHKCKRVDTDSIYKLVEDNFNEVDIFKVSTGKTYTIFINGFGRK